MDEQAKVAIGANQMNPMLERRMVQRKLWMEWKEGQQELVNARVFWLTSALRFLMEYNLAHWMIWMEWKVMSVLAMERVSCLTSAKENQMKPMLENKRAYWTLWTEW